MELLIAVGMIEVMEWFHYSSFNATNRASMEVRGEHKVLAVNIVTQGRY